MQDKTKVLITGAGGFIGHHLTRYLTDRGYWVRGVDIKEPEFEHYHGGRVQAARSAPMESCLERPRRDVDHVYGLAANMGGIGFIENNKAVIVRDNTLINLHSIEAARINGVKRYLYTSSACIYPGYLQKETDVTPLKEEDAYPGRRGRRLRLGETLHGTDLPSLPRRLRFGDKSRQVSQHFWTTGHVRRWARKISRGDLSQGCRWRMTEDTIEVWGDGEQTPVLLLHRRLC